MLRIAVMVVLLLLVVPNNVFAVDWDSAERITSDVDGNEYFVDKTSAYVVKGKKGDKEFRCSAIVIIKYSDFGKVKLAKVRVDPRRASYEVSRITFRNKNGKIGFRSGNGAVYDSSGNIIGFTGHWDSFSTIESGSVWYPIYHFTARYLELEEKNW